LTGAVLVPKLAVYWTVLRRPVLAASCDVVALARDSVLLRTANDAKIRHEPFWGAVLPLADGTRSEDQIADELESSVPLANTFYALMSLERENVLTGCPDPATVDVHVEGAVVVRDYLDPALADLPHPFVPVRVSGDSIWAGPLVSSKEIWDALEARLRGNLYGSARRSVFPPSDAALKIAACWVRQILADADQPALWTGEAPGATPRIHRFMPSPNGSVRDRLEQSVSPLTGLVPVIERLSETPVVVYQATQFDPLLSTAGKGMDDESARLSCIAEVAERRCMIWRTSEKIRRAAYRDVAGAVHPSALTHWSPRPFACPDNPEIDWVEARVVGDRDARRYLPAAYCYHGHPDGRSIGAEGDSNGCAAGATLDDAIAHGFLELVERDAFAIWWYNRIPRHSFPRELIDAAPAARRLRDSGYSLTVLDVTSDLGIPVAVALTAGADGVPRDIGFGAAYDAPTAIHRAALETGQLIATPQPNVWSWLRAAWQFDPAFLTALPPAKSPKPPGSMEQAIHDASLEVLFVDLTRQDLGIPVARVVSPTLRPPWPRFGPGRLYDVPVRCGWLQRARTEDEMNPIPFIL